MKESRRCPFCGKETTVEVDKEGYSAYLSGVNIVEAFPDMKLFIALLGFAVLSMCCSAAQNVILLHTWAIKVPLLLLLGVGAIGSITMIIYGIISFVKETYLLLRSCITGMRLDGDNLVDVEEGEYDEPV